MQKRKMLSKIFNICGDDIEIHLDLKEEE